VCLHAAGTHRCTHSREQPRQLGEIDGRPPRLILGEQFGLIVGQALPRNRNSAIQEPQAYEAKRNAWGPGQAVATATLRATAPAQTEHAASRHSTEL
jgi:hypothetical protein